MDGIQEELKLAELKKDHLRKSLEQAKDHASSVLLFTLQWKDLENHYDLVQRNIEKSVESVELREKELETEKRLLRVRQEEIGLKEKELCLLNERIEESNAELNLKQTKVDSMKDLLEEFKSKEEDLNSVRKLVEDCNKELGLKKEEFCSVHKLISECQLKLQGKEKQLRLQEDQIEKFNKDIGVEKEKLDLTLRMFDECEEKLKAKERELELVARRVDECYDEICLKSSELDHLQRSVDEKSKKLELKEMDLDLKENLMKEFDEALELKEKEMKYLQNSIKECSNQLELKQNELLRSQEVIEEQCKQFDEKEKILNSIQSLIQDYDEELEAKEKKFHALEKSARNHAAKQKYKEKELGLIEETIVNRSAELHSREIEFDSLQKLIKRSEKHLESTTKQLDSVKAMVRGYSGDLELKEQELSSIRMRIEERRQELHLKKKELSSVQISVQGCGKQLKAEEEELTSIKTSILECTKDLESRQHNLETMKKSQEQLSDELVTKEKQLDAIEKARSERLQEANEKEKLLDSLKRSLEERLEKLETEKKEFEVRVKEFELKEMQFDSIPKTLDQRSKELDLKEKQWTNARNSQVRSENPSSFFFRVPGIANTKTVSSIASNQIKTEQPEHFMVSNANETSSADLGVGAAMDGCSFQGIPNEDSDEYDLRQNEILAALQLSPDPAKFVLDLMLGTCSQHQKKGGTGFEESVLKIYVLMFEQLLQLSPFIQPNVEADAMKLAIEWKAKMKLSAENSVEVLVFLQFVAAFRLVSFFDRDEIFKLLGTAAQHQQAQNVHLVLGLKDIIADFLRNLIARKQYIEAVRFVCAFDCKEKFPPELFLNLLWKDLCSCMIGKNSPEVQEKAIDEQISALKSIIECIKECKLGTRVSVEAIEKRIAELEKRKMNMRFSASATLAGVQPEVQARTNHNTGPSVAMNQPSAVPMVQRQFQGGVCVSTPRNQVNQLQELSNKRARTNGPAIGSYTPQVPSVNNPYVRSPSPACIGVPFDQGRTHFGLAAALRHSSNLFTRQLNLAEEQYSTHNKPKQ